MSLLKHPPLAPLPKNCLDLRAYDDGHVRKLATAILQAPRTGPNSRAAMLAFAQHHGLMVFTGPWWFRLSMWIIRRRRPGVRLAATQAAFLEIEKADHLAVDRMVEAMATHVANGTDAEDRHSVGGWSQREIDLFVGRFAGHVRVFAPRITYGTYGG